MTLYWPPTGSVRCCRTGAAMGVSRGVGTAPPCRACLMTVFCSMDREQQLEHLRQADRHIAEAKALIERQREVVRELMEAGHHTEMAESALRALEGNLQAFERHRDLILTWTKDQESFQ